MDKVRRALEVTVTLDHSVSAKLFDEARALMPAGVSSPVRAFKSVGRTPVMVESARGAYLFDVGRNKYVDLVGSWGPALLGHSHPDVLRAVHEAADRGLSFGAPTPGETLLAKKIVERMTLRLGDQVVRGIDQVRFVSTGTEATMTAIRLARGITGKKYIVKFSGCYHGHSDSLLAAAGSGLATLSLPASAGVTAETAAQTFVLPYNDFEAVEAIFAREGHEIAAVITEAAPANMGVVPPRPGFNSFLSRITRSYGALFILDEVLTGFRVSPAGYWGLALENVPGDVWVPDIFTFGKVIGGGLPVAAVAGSYEAMAYLAPEGKVYQAGTLSGNPVAMAAGAATLDLATPEVYEKIERTSEMLSAKVSEELDKAGLSHTIQKVGSLFSVAFGTQRDIRNYDDAKGQHVYRYPPFFHTLLDNGVHLPPSAFEAWFLSAAHDDEAMEKIYEALPEAAQAAARCVEAPV